MQEFIDYLQELQDDDFDSKTQYIIENAIKAKEKEKNQIIDLCAEAYYLGLGHKDYNPEKNYDSNFGDKVEQAGI